MIPWEFLGSAEVPGDGGELRLFQRGEEFSIRVDGAELMNSRMHGSEDSLAELACKRIEGRKSPHVLIGGLGMGYTLAAALGRLDDSARVTVAELVPEVVAWNRGPLGHLAGNPLSDKRASVREGDVALVLSSSKGAFDAILLDVDNGPDGLTREENDRLYSRAGLAAAFSALTPMGILAVWSAGPDRTFTRRLSDTGFKVEEVRVGARKGGKGGRHTIWLAQRGK